MGVQLTLDSSSASLYYYINPQVPDVAYLSLKTISDVAPNCAADKVSLGSMGRLTQDEQKTALSKPTSAINHPGTIQVGDYWYNFEAQHQASCCDTSSQQDAAAKVQPSYDLTKVFKTIAPATTTPAAN